MIRAYRPEDADVLARVWFEASAVALPDLALRMGWSAAGMRDVFPGVVVAGRRVRVYVHEGAPVAFSAVDGELLDRLYVAPRCHRRGIGSALLRRACDERPSGLRVFTHVANRPARAFYEKHGFVAVKFGESPPPESEPDVLYRWRPGGIS